MKGAISFNDFCIICEKEAVIDGRKGASVNYRKIRQKVETFIPDGSLRISDIDEDWVKSFNDWLVSQGHEKSTISFYNRSLRSVYNQAVKKKLVKNTLPFEDVYTKVLVSHNPVVVDAKDGEKVALDSLSREELIRKYKSLAYKYNDMLYKLKGIVTA